jgi:transcriptional regulator with XRE-family HTH domain
MTSTRHGTARIRSLAGELKDLRDQAGLNTREAAAKVGMSASTLNRLENGSRTIDPEEVSALLVAYGVTGVERERLLSLAREVNLPGWWETSGSGGLPKHLPALIGFEAEATMIVHVSMLLVPGLLQTADYIRGVMSGMGVRGPDLETRVATRLGRQAVLTRPQPPQYLAILDEAVLRRPVDGAHIMADQLRHIIECAQKPHVDVRVLPFSRGAHTGLDGTYIVLEFDKARTIAYLEHKRSSLFVDEPDDVAPFHTATDTLLATALGPADSLKFLASASHDFSEG